jgi:hypothetical protein
MYNKRQPNGCLLYDDDLQAGSCFSGTFLQVHMSGMRAKIDQKPRAAGEIYKEAVIMESALSAYLQDVRAAAFRLSTKWL